MANVVGSLLIKIAADVAGVSKDIQTISNKFDKMGNNIQSGMKKASFAINTLVSVASIQQVVSSLERVTMKAIDTADQMRDFGRSIGIATDKLSGLEYAAKQSGVSAEALRTGLQRMTKNIAEAAHGLGETGKVIKALGLDAKTLSSQSPDKVFMDIVGALERIKNPADKALAAFKLFGRAGIDLVPLLGEGTGAINAWIRAAERLGIIISKEFADKADEANDAINNLNAALLGMSITLAEIVVGPLTTVVNKLTDLIMLSREDPGEFIKKLSLFLVSPLSSFTAMPATQYEPGKIKHPMPPRPPGLNAPIPGTNELDLGEAEKAAKKKNTAYDKYIDDAMKAIEEEKKLITQADKWYNDARKDQADRDKEEAAVAIKTEEDKWKAIIGTNEKMSDEMIESYLTHLRDMGATEEEIIQSRFDVWKRHTDDWKKGMEVGLKEFQDSLGTETEQWADITTNVFDSMRNTAGDFASALMWDFDNIGESFRNMLKQMAMDISRTLVQKSLIDPLMDNIGDFVGGLFSGDSGVGSDIFGGMFDSAFGGAMPWHSGGIIPKYHAGGRVPGTGSSLGILQGGEYVIPRLHLGRGSDDMSRNDRSNNYDTESIASKGRYGFYGYGYTGGGYSQLQELINQGFQVPDYSGANIPSGQLNKWDIPQFGFYGSELMKQYGIEAKPGASVGMPISYYEKYGGEAEPRFLSRLLLGNVGEKGGVVDPRFLSELLSGKGVGYSEKMHESYQRLVDALEYAFSGGLSTVLEDINKITIPSDANSMYRERIKIEAAKGGIDDYIYLMSALSGVGEGKSPWLSMLPGVPKIPYPTEAQDYLEKPPPSYGKSPPFHGKPPPIGSGWGQRGFMHSGGLLADEQMAILQAGEAVIPKKSVSMNRELVDSLISGGGKRFHEGGIVGQGQSSSPHITINVENRGSNPVNVTQGPTVVSEGRILATMVIDEIRRNPNMRNALRY